MKIAYVYDGLYPYLKGGAERRYFELATRLSARHDVHYITWRHWGAARAVRHAGFTARGVGDPRPFYGEDGRRTVGEAAAFALRLLPVLRRHRFDVIDCSATPYLPLYTTWFAARATGTPLVATWHEFWGDHWQAYLADRPAVAQAGQLAEAGCRPLGDIRVAVSQFTADRLAAGPHGTDARVVGNGVDIGAIRRVRPSAQKSDVVFVGRLIEDKKVDVLLRAVHRLVGEFPELRCTIVGAGPEREPLERLAGSLSLSDNVRFAGPMEDQKTIALLKSARVLALPSIREGFGITVIEALASGAVPIVARGPHTAAPALVRDGIDGLVCDPNPDSVAASLAGLLRDPSRLASMKREGKRAAVQWDWDRLAVQMEDLYQEARAGARMAA
jgi:glycosyltransferase involved in cell wall biosynthesis